MNLTIMLIILAVLPSVFIGTIIYKNDVVEKEPKEFLRKLFALGVALSAIVILLTGVLQFIIPFLAQDLKTLSGLELFISMFLSVALIEEGCKWLTFKLVAWNSKNFDYIYDAIVYSVFISLGFATIENVLYVVNGGLWVALVRSICSVPGHAYFGITMGYYLGLAKQATINGNKEIRKKNLFLSIIIPTTLHTIFNFCLFTQSTTGLIFYLVFLVLLFVSSTKKIKQLSRITSSM